MNLLDRVSRHGTYKKASSINGGEYHGPCPKCGGDSRFHVWPDQGDHGTFWCRPGVGRCGLGGDAIEYLMKIEGLSFKDACKEVGKELPEEEEYQAPKFKKPTTSDDFRPRETVSPSDLWLQHAEKLVEWSHQQLLHNPDQLAWCAARGLDLAAVKTYHLGWNPGEKGKDLYRPRESWGLETIFKEDGKTKKKLWIPIGLVIPCYAGVPGRSPLHRVRIRRPVVKENEMRYYLVPGSGTAPMILGENSRAYVVVESELDALLIHSKAADLTGAISQGNSTAKPDHVSALYLKSAISILVSLDSDDAGMNASIWWKKQYPQAERWPVPIGKDPGEAYAQGMNIREWVKAGLPPALTLPKAQPILAQTAAKKDIQPPGGAFQASAAETAEPVVHTITARDGREINITDDETAYQELVAAGKIVFSSKEMALVKQTGADPDQAARFLDAKEIFPGTRITNVERI